MTRSTMSLGETELVLESGKLALQAQGACVVTLGETQVLATCTTAKPRMQHLCHEEYQVLRDESQSTTISCSIFNVEMSERFLAHDGKIGEAEHFLKGGKSNP